MNAFDPAHYGSVFKPLLIGNRRRALDAGHPDQAIEAALRGQSVDDAFSHTTLRDRDMAACCIAGAWLLHDFLDESHTISQHIDTAEGSLWHAIMHRREGDFANSKYWYRHVGNHPVFNMLAGICEREWDAYAFVDQCQSAVHGKSNARELCLDIQQAEWELLFDYCYRKAIAD
jgi:hypothetical protein